MRFADPLSVDCPSCGKPGDYAPRELVALRSQCHHCAASLESVGQQMREGLSEWSGYMAKIEMEIELERVFGVEISDADFETIQTPIEFVPFYCDRYKDVESELLAVLSRARGVAASLPDLHVDFAELFPVTTHP